MHKVMLYISLLFLVVGCTQTKIDSASPERFCLPVGSNVVIGPFANFSDTPLANQQVKAMLGAMLVTKGNVVVLYKGNEACTEALLCPEKASIGSKIYAFSQIKHARYILTGSVNEWHYKVGLDGEPVASVSLTLIDVNSHRPVWFATGSKIGFSRDGLNNIGQRLLSELLGRLSECN